MKGVASAVVPGLLITARPIHAQTPPTPPQLPIDDGARQRGEIKPPTAEELAAMEAQRKAAEEARRIKEAEILRWVHQPVRGAEFKTVAAWEAKKREDALALAGIQKAASDREQEQLEAFLAR